MLPLYGSQPIQHQNKTLDINNVDQSLNWRRLLDGKDEILTNPTPVIRYTDYPQPLPASPGVILGIKAQLSLLYVEYFNYRLSADEATNILKNLQQICLEEQGVPILLELSNIISDRINYKEELSGLYVELFSLHIKNKDYHLAKELLENPKKTFFFDKDYQKLPKIT